MPGKPGRDDVQPRRRDGPGKPIIAGFICDKLVIDWLTARRARAAAQHPVRIRASEDGDRSGAWDDGVLRLAGGVCVCVCAPVPHLPR